MEPKVNNSTDLIFEELKERISVLSIRGEEEKELQGELEFYAWVNRQTVDIIRGFKEYFKTLGKHNVDYITEPYWKVIVRFMQSTVIPFNNAVVQLNGLQEERGDKNPVDIAQIMLLYNRVTLEV